MAKPRGRTIAISPFRRLVTDLMHFSAKVPSVAIDRRMNLAAVVAARKLWDPRPSWCVLFTKAYGVVAMKYPELRRCYLTFPWHRLYEHPHNVATLNIERETPEEKIVVYAHVRSPEKRGLADLDAYVRSFQETPLAELTEYKRARRLSLLPRPLRRFIWWGALNIFGRRRVHNYGTFGISSVAAQGAGILKLVPLLTSTIHYSMLDAGGCLDMRMSFDHRVLDGGTAARALTKLEEVMNGAIVEELRAGVGLRAAA